MNRKTLLPLLILGLLIPVVAGANIAGKTPREGIPFVKKYEPTKTTGYYTPNCEQFKDENNQVQWCHEGGCLTTTQQIKEEYQEKTSCVDDASWCCIPEDERGFYESVKCQGSAKCEGKLYHSSTIKPSKNDGVYTSGGEPHQNGVTRTGTDPEPKKTIAVNPNPDSECYIPYGSKVRIDFGPDHPWTNTYVAEDTGSAFRGDGKADNGNCKIDLYTGVGQDSLQTTADITRENIDVYILEWGSDEVPVRQTDRDTSRTTSQPHASGSTRAEYTQTVTFKPPGALWNKAKTIVDRKANCEDKPYEEKHGCFQDVLADVTSSQVKASRSCTESSQQSVREDSDIELKKLVVGGTVEEAGEIQSADGYVYRLLQVNTSQSTVSLNIGSEEAQDITQPELGDYVEIYDRVRPTRLPVGETVSIPETLRLDQSATMQVTSDEGFKDQLTSFILRSADCATSEGLCVCETEHPEKKIRFSGAEASVGTFLTGGEVKYDHVLLNASNVTTQLSKGEQGKALLKEALNTPQKFKDNLKQKIRDNHERAFQSPSTGKAYLLQYNDKVGFLNGKPDWYEPEDNISDMANNYEDILTGSFNSPQDIVSTIEFFTNPTASLKKAITTQFKDKPKSRQPKVPACTPQKAHQTVCLQYNNSVTDPIRQTKLSAMNLPPLKFTVQI
jgi:3D (Asp-Asp-Asp) domain-containing protein